MQGTYSTADSIVGPGIVDENGYFHDNGNAPYISADYEANLAEAKKLLADAGYPNGEATPLWSTAPTMPATMCLWQSTCSRLGAIWASP